MVNGYLNDKTFGSKKSLFVLLFALIDVNDLANKFKIFRKILKDGGYLLIRVHQYKFSKSYWKANHIKSGKKKEVSSNHFSTNSLKNLFNFHNFEIVLFEKNIEGVTIIGKKMKKI